MTDNFTICSAVCPMKVSINANKCENTVTMGNVAIRITLVYVAGVVKKHITSGNLFQEHYVCGAMIAFF